MPSDYTGNPDEFYDTLELPVGSDARTVSSVRVPLERLADNAAHLRVRADSEHMRSAITLRKKTTVFSDTANAMAAVVLVGAEGYPGPVIAMKAGQAAQAVYDHDVTEDYPGGNVPSIGQIRDAAVNPSGRIVIVGTSTPYNAFKVPGGSWTNGGAEAGGALSHVIYDPGYGGFMAGRTTNVWRSTDAVSWASVPTGLAGVQRLASIGAGAGAGRVIALSTATAPVFALSTNNGASFSASGGTVPHAAQADGPGTLQGCPLVSRLRLNERVYHVASYDSGARLRFASSEDGVTWVAGPTIEAPAGRTFSSTPLLKICQSSGLMVLAVETTITADSHDFFTMFASDNFDRWTGVSSGPGTLVVTGVASAGGRTLLTTSADLYASDGVQHEVFE